MYNIKHINPFGNAKFHHVGICIKSISSLCDNNDDIIFDPVQDVNLCFVKINDTTFELIEPASKKSPVYKSIQKGIKTHHMCYEVENLEDSLTTAKSNGFIRVSSPVLAVAFNKKIVWLYNKNFGLFELVES